MVVGGEEDVRGMEGETEVNKSEFGMRFHGTTGWATGPRGPLASAGLCLIGHTPTPHPISLGSPFYFFFSPGPAKANLLLSVSKESI